MAKTTKRTKRTASTKKRGLLSRINFNSKKTQFVAVIVIVALMGGGWFTYRSFAGSWAAQVDAAILDRSPVQENLASTGKNGKWVARLSPGESITWDLPPNYLQVGSKRRTCWTARYERPSNWSPSWENYGNAGMNGSPFMEYKLQQVSLQVGGHAVYMKEHEKQNRGLGNSYTQYAGAPHLCTSWYTTWGRDTHRFIVKNISKRTTIRVGLIFVERP